MVKTLPGTCQLVLSCHAVSVLMIKYFLSIGALYDLEHYSIFIFNFHISNLLKFACSHLQQKCM